MKRWYQKGAVQGGFVVGVAGIIAALIAHVPRTAPSESTRLVVGARVAAAPQSASEQLARPRTVSRSAEPQAAAPSVYPEPQEPERVGEVRPAEAPQDSQRVPALPSDVDSIKALRENEPLVLASLETVLTVQFRETLGSHYAEVTIAPAGQPATRFAVRNAGGLTSFSLGGRTYQVQVLAVDWSRSVVQVIVRASAAL